MISAETLKAQPATALPAAETFLRAHYRLQTGSFFLTVVAGDEAIHAASDVVVPMWNHSVWLDGDFGKFLAETERFHNEHGRRPVVYLSEEDAQAREGELKAAGFERFDRESWMARETDVAGAASDFEIEEPADLEDFTRVFRSAFSITSSAYNAALRRNSGATQRNLIARSNGEAIAIGTVICDGEVACLYNVGSAPQWRGRGAGRAMMEALLEAAREAGCHWAFLQVEAGSSAERLYTKLGFKTLFTRVGYRKADWKSDARLALTKAERELLLSKWAVGPEIKWDGQSVVELIESQARATPNATALIFADGANATLTYAAMMEQAARRACALIQSGVKERHAVGVFLPRSVEVVISMLAIWRVGAIFVPLDSSYPAERTEFMANDSGMKAVITDNSLSASAPAGIPKILVDSEKEFAVADAAKLEPSDPAYIIYTSGSTGQPKGVMISHGALAQHVAAMRDFYEITETDRHLHFSPFTFDASFEQLLPPLVAGASVVIRGDALWDVSEFVRNVSAFDLTIADLPMAYWHQLAQHIAEIPAVPGRLRLVIAGGETMSANRLAQWQKGPLKNVRLVNAYGPTEATITATAFDAARFNVSESAVGSVPIGRPLPGRVTYILDDELQPVPIRTAGQLYIGGPLLASGYLNRPELTAERFIANPFGEGRLYKTGDVARYLEDGAIEFLGRVDDQVKIRGFRVELGEIETALLEHASVREAVVVARGDIQKHLIAYVTARGQSATERELKTYLRSRLPEYMAPSAIIVLNEFPLLPSGKVNRKALPNPPEENATSAGAAPKTPLELQLQILFQRVLRRSGVGVDESFFELGGDSLQALELIVQIEKTTGKHLPLETLFQTPTVERLAAELERATKPEEWSSLTPLQKAGTRAPIYWVHTTPGDVLGYGNLIHHLGADQPCYGFQALGLKEGAKPHASIEAMAAHYVELLRKFQPNGPYYLGGWCFGGIVAVEMAQQLRDAGQDVAGLLLMETISAGPRSLNIPYHLHRWKCALTMSPQRWRDYLKAKAKYSEMESRMRFRHAADNVDPQQRRWLQRLEEVYNANLDALERYRQKFYPGKVTLFNAIERDPGVLPDPYYGWTGLAREIEIHEVAGNHDTMLAEPNVSSLADAIRKVLPQS